MALPSSRATLIMHDLVSDPGGDPNTCHNVFRSAAFQHNQMRRLSFRKAKFILTDHNYTVFGAQYRPCILIPSGFGPPLLVLPSDFTTTLLAKL